MGKTDDQLRSEVATNESRAELGAWGVVAGLVLEIALATAKSLGYHIKDDVENWGTVLATCLITIGVYCEIHFGRRSSHANSELRQRADARAAKLEKEAADARGRVADIERETSWRHISEEKSAQIALSIAPLTHDVDLLVGYEGTDSESWSYSFEISKIFVTAGISNFRRTGEYTAVAI